MRPPTTTRRRVLAAVGVGALSGCTGLFDDEADATIDGTEFQTLGAVPTVDRPLPVTLDAEHFATARERAESLLAPVPENPGPDEVPNEAIRNELTEASDEAGEELGSAAGASSTVERLERLRYARGSAANANATWRSIDGDLDRATVREEVDEIDARLPDVRDRWSYVGDDPIRAVVVHEAVESLLDQVDRGITDDVERNLNRPENAVSIGLLAGELERARAALDDAAGALGALEASVSGDVSTAIESGVESLVSTLEARKADLPEGDPDEPSSFVDTDVSDTPAAWALRDLYRQRRDLDRVREAVDTDRHAIAALRAHRGLAQFEAFESLRERVNDGETFEVTSAEDVTRRRSAAISAIEDALDESAYPVLARSELSRSVAVVRFNDDRLRDHGDTTSPAAVRREVSEYLVTEEIARAVPSADRAVADALDAAEDNP